MIEKILNKYNNYFEGMGTNSYKISNGFIVTHHKSCSESIKFEISDINEENLMHTKSLIDEILENLKEKEYENN